MSLDDKPRISNLFSEVLNITNDKKFKIFFKETITAPLSSFILSEIYPYVYLSIIFVIISFLLILSIFILMVRQFNILNIIISNKNSISG